MSTDPIADMLAKIVNASKSRIERVDVPRSKVKENMLKIMQKEGFIKSYKLIEDRKQGILRIYLQYGPNNELVITGARRISKPSLRRYATSKKIPKVFEAFGITIVSTPKGIITDTEAKNLNLGGEVLCSIW